MLAHQRLWPPRRLAGKVGIMDFIRHAGCIQFDPIDVVGRNPDLVLQARVQDYRPGLLEELLYTDRQLVDGWDKVAAIYPMADWPYFTRRRAAVRRRWADPSSPAIRMAPTVIEAIHQRGPLSSIDLKHDDKVDWIWGVEVRLVRACLEVLYGMGELLIHHRVGTRRAFELAERALPHGLLSAPDPNLDVEHYRDWHVLRRVGGLGLANPSASEYWQGILDTQSQDRRASLARLVERGDLLAVAVDDARHKTFFMRAGDLPMLEAVQADHVPDREAAILGPLDNLMWDRNLLRWVFDFDYVWEVYKPASLRTFGYYVLPVLYGERFAARFDPAYDKKRRVLTIANWWWEAGVRPDEAMQAALVACFRDFMRYLGAERLQLGETLAGDKSLDWVLDLERTLKLEI